MAIYSLLDRRLSPLVITTQPIQGQSHPWVIILVRAARFVNQQICSLVEFHRSPPHRNRLVRRC